MNRIVGLFLVIVFMLLARFGLVEHALFADAESTLTFGFLLLAAYLFGDVLSRFGVPKLTGYILAGIGFGPSTLGLVTEAAVADLRLINDLALSFIALAAGGELRIAVLRPRMKSLLWTLTLQLAFIFTGVTLATLSLGPLLPFVEPGSPELVAVAVILGAVAVARSPSSAIAIISECKASGPFTETVLGVTVILDLVVIVLFAGVVSFAQGWVDPAASMDLRLFFIVLVEVTASIVGGIAIGLLLSFYIRHVQADLAVFVLGVAFLVAFLSRHFASWLDEIYSISLHLEPMLMCVTAGFWVQNFSRGGQSLMEQIDRSSLPIYVVFFALTGAALDIGSLRETWQIAAILVCLRFALIWVGAFTSARIAGDPKPFGRLAGMAYVTQAGVSLGLAEIVARRFPDWGPALATVLIAVITLNQVIGPVAFKYALSAVGEAGVRRVRGTREPAR